MQVSAQGRAFIARNEGFVSCAYRDAVGVITIGYGFTMRSRSFSTWWLSHHRKALALGDGMTRHQADDVLVHLLDEEYAPLVEQRFGPLPQARFDACVSATYNLGPRCLQWKWAAALAAGNATDASAKLSRTGVTAGGRKLAGLVRRRKEEADLLLSGSYGQGREVTDLVSEETREAQRLLARLGYHPGPIDGRVGAAMREAVRRFQADHPPLLVDGRVGPATSTALRRATSSDTQVRTLVSTVGLSVLGGATQGVGWARLLLTIAALCLLIVSAFCAWRYRGVLKNLLRKRIS